MYLSLFKACHIYSKGILSIFHVSQVKLQKTHLKLFVKSFCWAKTVNIHQILKFWSLFLKHAKAISCYFRVITCEIILKMRLWNMKTFWSLKGGNTMLIDSSLTISTVKGMTQAVSFCFKLSKKENITPSFKSPLHPYPKWNCYSCSFKPLKIRLLIWKRWHGLKLWCCKWPFYNYFFHNWQATLEWTIFSHSPELLRGNSQCLLMQLSADTKHLIYFLFLALDVKKCVTEVGVGPHKDRGSISTVGLLFWSAY